MKGESVRTSRPLRLFAAIALVLVGCQTTKVSANREVASFSLTDPTYSFDVEKVQQLKSPFDFVRSFIDYFYLVVAQNKNNLFVTKNFSRFDGKCVGDAHPENFGFLIQENGTPKFTVNDIDDFGPCPVVFDLYRFLMSSSIYDPNIDLTAIFNSYLSGLKDESVSFPKTIQALYDNAVKHGSAINPKKVVNSKFVRDSSTVEINPAITALITNSILSSYPSAKILDVVKTTKIGGGSSGLTRYQVLMTDKGITRHLEMKEQKRPSIYPIATAELPDVKAKIFDALHSEQGPHASSLYGYAKIENMEMFIRPIFMGNIGVNLSADPQENYDKVNFEAFTLGQIHRLSVSNLDDYIKALQGSSFEDWKSDVGSMTDLVRQKYKTIHP